MNKKYVLSGGLVLFIVAAIIFAGILWPSPEPGRSRKLFCALLLEDQAKKASTIFEVEVISSRETHPGSEACVYDLRITAVLLGSAPTESHVKSLVEEGRFINPKADEISCKPVGSTYLLLATQEPSGDAFYRCGNAVLLEQSQKEKVIGIIKRKGA